MSPRIWTDYPDGTKVVRLYPPGTTFEQHLDVEPIFEVWRDPEGNVIERPDPELYSEIPRELMERLREDPTTDEQRKESERRRKEWMRPDKVKERHKRRVEKQSRKLGLSPEEYKHYNEAVREYHDVKLWKPGPARRPQPEDFRGTSP